MLARQVGFFPILWLDFNGPQGMREKRVAPLIIEGLANLGLMTQLCHGSSLQTMNDDLCLQGGIPPSSVHG